MRAHFFRTSIFALALSAGLSIFSLTAQAQVESDDGTNVLLVDGNASAKSAAPMSSEEEMEVRVDLSGSVTADANFNRADFINKSLQDMKQEISKDKVFAFEGPQTEAQLEKVLELSDADIAKFLAKKRGFLAKAEKTFGTLRFSPKKINKVLKEMNSRFYDSSRVIAKSNTKVVSAMFSLSGGLALPQKIVEALKKRSIGKYIPETGGFYYLLGLGVGIGRRVDQNKKAKFVFEIFMDVEKLKSTVTGIVELSAAGTYGVVFEHRDDKFESQQNKTMYGGPAGVFRQGETQFGWAASTGISVPPGIGAFLVYQDTTTRFYLFRTEGLKATFPALSLIKSNFVSAFSNIVSSKYGNLCSKALL